MIAILDYGVGNLFSLQSSFAAIGQQAVVTGDEKEIAACQRIILPGVGAFADAAQKLFASGLDRVLRQQVLQGKPLLGICLGMQLLFDKSLEYGEHAGLGLIPGTVVPMQGKIPAQLKIPHIGWNALQFSMLDGSEKSALYRYVQPGECVYFVHSYYADECAPYVTATAQYGIPLTASVQRDNVYGTQFHPEKSGDTGLRILKAFCEI